MALPVNFDPNAAIRIYNAVRKVEAGDRDQKPLTFQRVLSENTPKVFKLCLFTGSWQIATSKIVAMDGNSAATLSVTNLFFPITATVSETYCAVAKAQGSWLLVSVPFETATAISITSTATALVVSGYSTSNATILTGGVSGSEDVVVDVSAVLDTVTCDIDISLTKIPISTFGSAATTSISFVSSIQTSTTVISESTALIEFLRIKDA